MTARDEFHKTNMVHAQRKGISIIIPAYNANAQLMEAIHSVYEQGLNEGEFEVIVVNDQYSPNDEAKKETHQNIFRTLEEWRQSSTYSGLRIIDSCEAGVNCGQSAAKNAGMAAATFPIIALLDSDDLYETDPAFLTRHGSYLSHGCEILENNPEATLVICDLRHFGAGQDWIDRRGDDTQDLLMMNRVLALNVANPAIFRRKDALDPQVKGFDTSLDSAEDALFFPRLVYGRFSKGLGTQIEYLDTPYYCYRQHPPHVETVNRRDFDLKRQVLQVIQECLPLYKLYFGEKSPEEIYRFYEALGDASLSDDAVPVVGGMLDVPLIPKFA